MNDQGSAPPLEPDVFDPDLLFWYRKLQLDLIQKNMQIAEMHANTKLQNDQLIEYAIQLRVKDHATNDRTASLKVCIETFLFALLFALEKLPHASLKVCIEAFLLAWQNFHYAG